jgi:hypothetical protein
MSRKSYIGGSTVLTQRRADYEATLARDAVRHRRRMVEQQRRYDEEQRRERQSHQDKVNNELRRFEEDLQRKRQERRIELKDRRRTPPKRVRRAVTRIQEWFGEGESE